MTNFFISDLHLSDKRPDLIRAFVMLCDYIKTVPNAQLHILGDFYEAWIGDDFQPSWNIDIIATLNTLNDRGINVTVTHGNRDFLLGPLWAKDTAVTLQPNQWQLTSDGIRLLLLHGDECCLQDTEYQAFRQMVRQTTWQTQFLAKPLDQRLAIAESLRENSKQISQQKTYDIMDVDDDAIKQLEINFPLNNLIIHGHTHRPALHLLSDTPRLVLGDWDTFVWVAKLSDQTISQYQITLDKLMSLKEFDLSNATLSHQLNLSAKDL